jgi:Zn-dependent membrane protease YugP
VHLVTLPVEFDASFGRALPILKEGQYINNNDYLAARKILTACALTYLASSLSGLLNFWRWLRMLRR